MPITASTPKPNIYGWSVINQPNNEKGDEDCVALTIEGWHDWGAEENCEAKLPYVCAFDLDSCCTQASTSSIQLPPGAASVCSEGAVIPSGSACSISRGGKTCDAMTCVAGAWHSSTPSCGAACPYDNLTVPPGATSSGHVVPTHGCRLDNARRHALLISTMLSTTHACSRCIVTAFQFHSCIFIYA